MVNNYNAFVDVSPRPDLEQAQRCVKLYRLIWPQFLPLDNSWISY